MSEGTISFADGEVVIHVPVANVSHVDATLEGESLARVIIVAAGVEVTLLGGAALIYEYRRLVTLLASRKQPPSYFPK